MSYIKLDRKMLEWEWIGEPNTLALWIHILLSVNYKPSNWKGMRIGEGEMVTSVSTLSFKTGLTTQQTRTALSKLEATNEITRKTTNNYTLIKVTKWNDYQTDNKQITSDSTSQLTTLKEYKNTRNKEINNYSQKFGEAMGFYREHRKKLKRPLTEHAEALVVKKLKEMADDEDTQIAILNQSIAEGWQGIFPLKNQPDKLPTYSTSGNKSMSQSEEEELLALMKGN